MSGTYVSAKLRLEVVLRAGEICEYCLVHQDDTWLGSAIDRVISVKHGGRTEREQRANENSGKGNSGKGNSGKK